MPDDERLISGTEQGIELFKQGRYPEAVELFKLSIAQNSSDVKARNYLAATHSQMGNNMDAVSEFLALIQIDPTNPQYYFNLGMVYEKIPNVIKAEESYAKALELNPAYLKAKERIEFIKKTNIESSTTQTLYIPSQPQPTQSQKPPQMAQATQYQLGQPARPSVPPNTQYAPQYAPQPNTQYYPGPMQQSYQAAGDVPFEVKSKLNWGAFLMGWIWGIGNGVSIALLGLIPVLHLAVSVYLLIKGNELAWKSREFESIDSFFKVQRIWLIVGLVLFVISYLLYLTIFAAMIHQYLPYFNYMRDLSNMPKTPNPQMPG